MPDRHARQPTFAGRYGPTATVALLALCPNIMLTTAVPLAQHRLMSGLHASQFAVQLGEGLSNAGYAFGAVLAAFLVQRFRQRLLFLATETVFVVGSLLAATAPVTGLYVAGRVVQGATTGLMLIIALPPWVTRYGVTRLPRTAALVNIGLFGAVTVGPLLGGAAGQSANGWRWLLAAVAVAGVVGVLMAALTLPHDPPFNPDVPADQSAFALATAGTVLPFFGVTELTSRAASSPWVWAPIAVGLAALVALIVRQYRRTDALMPVRALSTSLPVIGTIAAMVGGAAVVTLVTVTVTSLAQVQRQTPLHTGLLLTPQVAGVALAAFAFAKVLRTRWLPLIVAAGLVVTVGAALLLRDPTQHALVFGGAALLGAGAGCTVSPGLFLAGFGVESSKIGRAFALVELLRAEAAYLVGPVLLYVAEQHTPITAGFRLVNWVVIALVAATLLLLALLYRASGVHPHAPDLEAWLGGDERALHSPPPAQAAREKLASTSS